MLLGGGKKSLYVYEPGYTEWKNATEKYKGSTVTKTLDGSADSAKIENSDGLTGTYSIQINEATYKNYSKLVMVASISDASVVRVAYWGSSYISTTDAVKFAGLTKSKATYELDITSYSGTRYLQFQLGKAVISIYDIHFE